MPSRSKFVIFDLDDTLVDTSHVYWVARKKFIDLLRIHGIEENLALEVFEHIDAENIKSHGLIPSRYGKTMMDAYHFFQREKELPEDLSLEKNIRLCGEVVINSIPKLINGARHLLKWASERFELALLTRGIPEMQQKKIESRRIVDFFETIEIVPHKGPEDFRRVMEKSGFNPAETWVIGDSIRSDINPALEVGANAILYRYTHHSYYWRQEYGESPGRPFFHVDALTDIERVLESPETVAKTTPAEWAELVRVAAST